ncbi:MAG: hypothetical protein ACYC0V_20710 [Armatimonadota bacterium]
MSYGPTKQSLLFIVLVIALSSGPAKAQAPVQLTGDTLFIGPNVGWNTPIQAPIDLVWDAKTRRLHLRSLNLTETGDAVDLRIRRLPGKYPDGPDLANQSVAGEIPGGIHWDALTPDGGWRQVAGIEGVLGDQTGPAPTAASHPGWLTFYTYSKQHDDRIRRVLIDDTGGMSLGGGGFGSEGLPAPAYGLHLFGGGLRIQQVANSDTPRLTVVGEGGTTEYTYRIVGLDSKGHPSFASNPSVVRGPAQLSDKNFIRLQWDRSPGAESYWIIRNGERLDINFQGEGNSKTFEDDGDIKSLPYVPITRNASADAEIDGSITAKQAIYTPGVCAPKGLKGVVSNYFPAGLESASSLAINPAGPVTITGIRAPDIEGRWLLVLNLGASPVTLSNGSKQSIAANTILTGTGKDIVLRKDQMIQLVYLMGHWRLLSNGQ